MIFVESSSEWVNEYSCPDGMSETWDVTEHGDLLVYHYNIHAQVQIASYAAGKWATVKRLPERKS